MESIPNGSSLVLVAGSQLLIMEFDRKGRSVRRTRTFYRGLIA